MQNRIYETIKRLSVRLSVCSIDRPQQQRAADFVLNDRRPGDIYRLLHSAPAAGAGAQRQRRRSTALSSKCGQCRADS